MANSNVAITEGSGKNIDTRTTTTDGDHRQVIVLGDPSIDNNVVNAVTADPGASSTTPGIVMRLAGSASVQVVGGSGSIGIYFDRANPSVAISSVTGSVGIYFDRSNPSVTLGATSTSIGIYFDRGNPSVNIGGQTGTFNVALDPGHTLGSIATVGSITNTVAVYFDRGNPTITANAGSGTFNVSFSPAAPAIGSVVNTVAVYFDRAKPSVLADTSATASIFTASGSTSTAGNNTLVSPSANYNFKVFAYSLTTTGVSSMAPRFTTGASAGATELWRVALQAPSAVGTGANLAIQPPGFLFATGVNATLSLYLDTGSLIHYSVSYIKETA